MRETSFKAYNKKTKQLEFVLSIDFTNMFVEVLPYANLEGGSTECWDFDDIDLLQYTGLKDKNGVEIYEGDILRGETECYINGYKSDVTFYRGSFIISLAYDMIPVTLSEQKMIYEPSDYPNTEKYNWLSGYEVIGNIYEPLIKE